jgi:hypothetical protein
LQAAAIVFPLACLAVTAFIAATVVFEAERRRQEERTDFYLHVHAAGEWWISLGDFMEGWRYSALGRWLFIGAVTSAVTAEAVYVLAR